MGRFKRFQPPAGSEAVLLAIILLSLFLSGCASALALSSPVRDADELAARGAWDEAVFKYAEARHKDPDSMEYKLKYSRARVEAARVHFKRGEKHFEEGDHEAALLEYRAALLLNPSFKRADERLRKTKRVIDSTYHYGKGVEFIRDGKTKEARSAFKRSASLNPDNAAAMEELDKLTKSEGLVLDGFELDLKSSKPITIEFKDVGIKKVFGVLSKLSGINFVFDADLRDTKTTIFLKDASFKSVLKLILLTNKLARKVVSENTIVVYPATPQKAKQYEEMYIKVFYLSNIDAKSTVNLLRTMIKVKDIFVHTELNAIVIRARPEAIELARRILDAVDLADAEVLIEVDIIEINRTKSRNLGIDLPDSLTVTVPQTTTLGGVTGITLGDLKSLSSKDLLITFPSGVINFGLEELDAEVLANPRIRVKNNEKAKIHIGDRVPIITTTVLSGGQTQENVQYLDVGLKLSVEPTIRPNDEIDLKISLEVSSLGTKTTTNSGSVFFQIGTRNTDTVLRLSDGETQIIGGLITREERSTIVKVPGLGEIPIIGRFFANEDTSVEIKDILMSITPHIIRRVEVPDESLGSIPSGSQDFPSTRPLLEGFQPAPRALDEGEAEAPFLRDEAGPEEAEPSVVQPPPPPPPGIFPVLPEGMDSPGVPPGSVPHRP